APPCITGPCPSGVPGAGGGLRRGGGASPRRRREAPFGVDARGHPGACSALSGDSGRQRGEQGGGHDGLRRLRGLRRGRAKKGRLRGRDPALRDPVLPGDPARPSGACRPGRAALSGGGRLLDAPFLGFGGGRGAGQVGRPRRGRRVVERLRDLGLPGLRPGRGGAHEARGLSVRGEGVERRGRRGLRRRHLQRGRAGPDRRAEG
ncbi:MAG: Uncharacterized lipoprotein aminopeptidase LpqL, partial [uncultured Rubrobacteraceae bacterium]